MMAPIGGAALQLHLPHRNGGDEPPRTTHWLTDCSMPLSFPPIIVDLNKFQIKKNQKGFVVR